MANNIIDLYGCGVELYFYINDKAYTMQDVMGGYAKNNIFSGVSFLSNVKIEIDLLKFTQIEITLNPPFDEAVKLIESGVLGLGYAKPNRSGGKQSTDIENQTSVAKFVSKFNMIGIRLHYGGQSTNLYKGIQLQPEISIGLDGITITLKAIGLLFQESKKTTTKAIKNNTYKQVFENYTANTHTRLVIDPKDTIAVSYFNKPANINANASTNMDEMKKALNQSGCVMIDTGVVSGKDGIPIIQIASMQFARSLGCQVTLAAFRNINPNKKIFPILELDTTIASYQFGLSLGLQGASFDPEKKEQVSKSKTDMTANSLAKKTNKIASSDGTTSGGSSDKSIKDKAMAAPFRAGVSTAIDKMKGWMQTMTDSAFQYNVTTVGCLFATPGRPVNVDVGKVSFLSNVYDCYRITHDVSESGCQTIFNLSRTFGLASAIENAVEPMKNTAARTATGKQATAVQGDKPV